MPKPRLETVWVPLFWKTIINQSAPGGKVDAYLVVDDDEGFGLITLCVPHGDSETAKFVCDAVNTRIQEEKKRGGT